MNLLLLNFDFPPNPGIGGRRWAKISKALALDGHSIHVVKARYRGDHQKSTWQSDVISPSIHLHEVDNAYPESQLHPPHSILEKLRYRCDQLLLKKREQGSIYDKAIGWDKELMPLCRQLITEKNIDAIIATGAPWNLLVYGARLKQEFPNCKYLADYRDPWLNAVNYGMQGLSPERKKTEENKQKFVFQHADVVTTPYTYLTAELATWCKQLGTKAPKFATVEHFYDPEDYKNIGRNKSSMEEIRIVYAGDIYVHSEEQWRLLRIKIEGVREQLKQSEKKVRFDIYPTAPISAFMRNVEEVHIHEPIGKGIYSELEQADVLLIVLPKNKKNERTTKFFEYLPYRKPLFIVADIGEVTDFVEQHRLGIHIHAPESDILKLLTGKFLDEGFNRDFDIDTCTSNERASQIIKLLA